MHATLTPGGLGDSLDEVALFRHLPQLRGRMPWVRLGDWPTPVEPLDQLRALTGGPPIWIKREDLSSKIYGGNKVRTLESVMGRAVAAGAQRIWGTGAFGSNHTLAAVLHAPSVGLEAGMALFPQPRSRPAIENLRAALSMNPAVVEMRTALSLPFVMARLRRRAEPSLVMKPGGATPEGTFGAMSAALELAEQVEHGDCPAPASIVIPVGSACTTAGLLVGLQLAAGLGVGFGLPGESGRPQLPQVIAVRVTPWPISSAFLILRLARQSAKLLAELAPGLARVRSADLGRSLTVVRRDFGAGYGKATARGVRAIDDFARTGGPPLDIVYSGKAAATLLTMARTGARGPLLFWSTKSSAPLPDASPDQIAGAPRALRRWLSGY